MQKKKDTQFGNIPEIKDTEFGNIPELREVPKLKNIEHKKYKGAIFTYKVSKSKSGNSYISAFVSGRGTPNDKKLVDKIKLVDDSNKEIEIMKNKFDKNLTFHKGVQSEIYNENMPKTSSIFIRKIGDKIKKINPKNKKDGVQYVVTAKVKINGKSLPVLYSARSKSISRGGTKEEALRHIRGQLIRDGLASGSGEIFLTEVDSKYEYFS